ncbi:MAG TPA: GrpB family protein [Patescibacteria group bacterium]|nr:GrpB family protein [Patescibacteria group bacterium]
MSPGRAVRIVEYDPNWPNRFEWERARVMGVIGDHVLAVEHMGSTSVPGLGAKPIIDIMAGVRDRETADLCQGLLFIEGYDDVTPEPGQTEWFYCLGTDGGDLYFHLHLVIFESSHWKRQLMFRDYMRGHPERAREYYEMKVRLAADYGSDRQGYTEAKTRFILKTLELAEKE